MSSDVERLLDEARAALADQRYGPLTHPFVLGLLTAAQVVSADSEKRAWANYADNLRAARGEPRLNV